ncbi:MAG: hypothetical protein ABID45_01475 [Patescibacteria group bacterium]
MKKETLKKILYWSPRILGIVFIVLINLIQFIGYLLSPDMALREEILSDAIHWIQNLILVAILLVTWKWGDIGIILYLSIGIIYFLVLITGFILAPVQIIFIAFLFIIGLLFLLEKILSKKLINL